jgi:ribosomal protein S18 acetylase RimI-like enzyme
MLQIKKLPERRWKEFQALRLEALENDPLAFGSSYEEEIKFTDDIWKNRIHNTIFALHDDKLVGMIVVLINPKIKLNHFAEISGVFVKEDFRNKDVGKQLIKYAINLIRQNKRVLKIKLTVTSVQDSAIILYSSFGFEIVGRLHKELKFEDKFYDGIIMEKIL